LIARVARTTEIVVPIQVFTVLRRELEKEVGTLPAVRALHHAGYASGVEAAGTLQAAGAGESVPEIGARDFWERIQRFFAKRGWGSLTHEMEHPGVGFLRSVDWVEADAEETDPEASCSFGTGFLAGLLSEIAGAPVAVLEVTCRGRGDEACSFAFGSEPVIHDLYGRMLDGADLQDALDAL
jgi:hypothetical protein